VEQIKTVIAGRHELQVQGAGAQLACDVQAFVSNRGRSKCMPGL